MTLKKKPFRASVEIDLSEYSSKFQDPNVAADFIMGNAGRFAAAKAERLFLDEFRKSKKALLMNQSPARSAVEREQFAYSHPDYVEVLKGIRVAVEVEEQLRWEMIGAQLCVEIWRTRCANDRNQDKALR